jgi:hypothetical protein
VGTIGQQEGDTTVDTSGLAVRTLVADCDIHDELASVAPLVPHVEARPGKDLDGQDRVAPTVETFHLEEEGEYLVLDTGRRANSS